jgi:hypothetical protein
VFRTIREEAFSSPQRIWKVNRIVSRSRFTAFTRLTILIAVFTSALQSAKPESKPGSTEPDALGIITLEARAATTHGTQMHYEDSPLKNCLGYWLKPEDWAEWQFQISRPGTFYVEVWQGCGQGQGGSEVNVELGS